MISNNSSSTERLKSLKSLNASHPHWLLILTFGLLLFSVLASIAFGSAQISIGDAFSALVCPLTTEHSCQQQIITNKIIWEIRLPRILIALITGMGLSVAGAVLQTITRNPLADPYLFGISSGAALGAVVIMVMISSSIIGMTLGAFLGSFLAVLLMLMLAGKNAVRVERLLLSGVAVSFMLSAFTSMILYFADPNAAANLLFWMMGSFANTSWPDLIAPTFVIFPSLFIFFSMQRWLGALLAGDESAHTLGIPVNKFRLLVLLMCALMTAVLVAQSGGIGFVGLMIPHIARYLVGANIKRVLLMSCLLGGSFMIWVDVVARSVLAHQVLPIGIVTSAVGSVFFFIILRQRSHSG
ncbi:iron ABC transporter permease [Pleionea sp. CnH1-48]|uniref:FecCD family ABC transporter permease n=1 Tax=Pleionea sp. CnH1-48 TaxID=2954494 RepID=UPI0020978445|nr:iron ABC transporter permease [Pleionea sp. CnH1-48]MCO7227041.1 iron ABC transporter permease [Pleionea sp. CnH1-48]